jgi:DNA ligase-1
VTLLAHLVGVSERVAATSGRLSKVRALADFLRALPPEDVETAVLYLAGETPQGRIGIGYASLQAAADAAATIANAASTETLAIADIDRALTAIAAIRGSGSGPRRDQALGALFSRATPREQRFLIQLLAGELRQGALTGVMLDAIADASRLPALEIRRAAMYAGNLGHVAVAALTGGLAALGAFQLEVFSPVSPMLAQTAADVGEALRQLGGEAAFEWKMDGARVQVHKDGGEVRVYTRGLNDVSAAVPEIVEAARALPPTSVVLDGEAIAFDQSGRPRPFQVTIRRFGRRLDGQSPRAELLRAELPIRAFFFDCLRIGASSIAQLPTRERYRAMTEAVPLPLQMPRLVTASEDEARAFYEAALQAGHEGVMAKSLEAPYEAGNRGASWLKIKRAHTLDLVVLAAEWGHGRRTGKLSNLHLGAVEPSSGEYVMLGKTFKGLTDVMLDWQTRELLARETRRDSGTVYVRPELVVEVAFSDLQASVRYPGGLALRLARVKRYRDDKTIADADTMDSVRAIYAAQTI